MIPGREFWTKSIWMSRPVNCSFSLDPAAAEHLGCRTFTRFLRITLPLIRPGVFAGGIIVFIWSFTELGTPLMLGYYRVTAVQVFNGVTQLE